MTLKDLTIAKKSRKGEPDGRNKRGAYWTTLSVKTAGFGGDGIGQNAPDIDWFFEIRHYRDGRVQSILRRHSWHQNTGTNNDYADASKAVDMDTIEDVLDYLASLGEGDYEERYYVDSYHREDVTKAIEEFGLGHAKAPDEILDTEDDVE
jgi:hypothetical protein